MFSVIASLSAYCQISDYDINKITEAFKLFEYEKVTQLSEMLLSKQTDLLNPSLIEVYRMKATAHYSLAEEYSARECFIKILQIDPDYTLDPVKNSPKIISLFNSTKTKLLQKVEELPAPPSKNSDLEKKLESNLYRAAYIRSILLPGWGHLYIKQLKKGRVLTTSTMAALSSSIYFSILTAQREKAYLNETDRSKIESRYSKYNQAYHLRNNLLFSFAAIWFYSQYDIFKVNILNPPKDNKITCYPIYLTDRNYTLNFSYNF